MTLPAFAAERRRACSTAPSVRLQLLIDISYPQGAQQQTRRPPLLLLIDGTDRRTDKREIVKKPCSSYYEHMCRSARRQAHYVESLI